MTIRLCITVTADGKVVGKAEREMTYCIPREDDIDSGPVVYRPPDRSIMDGYPLFWRTYRVQPLNEVHK